MIQAVEYLPGKHEALRSNPSTVKEWKKKKRIIAEWYVHPSATLLFTMSHLQSHTHHGYNIIAILLEGNVDTEKCGSYPGSHS
jgi:anaerobic selenocysteine-containing dehydrogenase